MRRYASLFLLILLLSACAPAQAASPVQTMTFSATPKQAAQRATDTPRPPTSTPHPPTATTVPTEAFITMVMSTKYAWRTMEALTPTPTLTPTILSDSPACRPEDLQVSYGQSGASGHIILDIRVKNTSSTNCFLPADPVTQILDPARKPFNIIYSYFPADGPVVSIPPTDAAQPGRPALFGLQRGQSAVVSYWWGNWCGKSGLPKEFIIQLELLDKAGKIEVANHEFLGSTACDDPGAPSTINVEPFFVIVNP